MLNWRSGRINIKPKSGIPPDEVTGRSGGRWYATALAQPQQSCASRISRHRTPGRRGSMLGYRTSGKFPEHNFLCRGKVVGRSSGGQAQAATVRRMDHGHRHFASWPIGRSKCHYGGMKWMCNVLRSGHVEFGGPQRTRRSPCQHLVLLSGCLDPPLPACGQGSQGAGAPASWRCNGDSNPGRPRQAANRWSSRSEFPEAGYDESPFQVQRN